jgi:hypothetical protein
MGLLVYLTEINRKIGYEKMTYKPTLLFVFANSGSFSMVFLKKDIGFNYIELVEENYTIRFEETNEIDLNYRIFFGDLYENV